jgi:hypothetical protein
MKYLFQTLIVILVVTIGFFSFQTEEPLNETALLKPQAETEMFGPCGPCNDGWRVCSCGTSTCVEQCDPGPPDQ